MESARRTGFLKGSPNMLNVRRFPGLLGARGLLLGLFLGAAVPATATPEYILPTLFDVVDVASDDVLNIREAPNASAAIIGALSPDARDIEVVGYDPSGQWARINTGEQSGWAALRYLAYQVDVWKLGSLPPSLHCFGTEPFWSIKPSGDLVEFSTSEEPESTMRIEQVLTTGIFRDPRRTISANGDDVSMIAVVVPMACSDGMSDRTFGLDVTALVTGRGEPQMLTGCCSIAPR